jgi:hypothetical protein
MTKLIAAMFLHPINRWNDEIFKKHLRLCVRVCDHLDRWHALTMLKIQDAISPTNLFEDAGVHKSDGTTNCKNLENLNFNKRYGQFLLNILPRGPPSKTSTSNFVMIFFHCRFGRFLLCVFRVS